jgi:hypothetical protein
VVRSASGVGQTAALRRAPKEDFTQNPKRKALDANA